jgi:hypothetical protein
MTNKSGQHYLLCESDEILIEGIRDEIIGELKKQADYQALTVEEYIHQHSVTLYEIGREVGLKVETTVNVEFI